MFLKLSEARRCNYVGLDCHERKSKAFVYPSKFVVQHFYGAFLFIAFKLPLKMLRKSLNYFFVVGATIVLLKRSDVMNMRNENVKHTGRASCVQLLMFRNEFSRFTILH